MVARHAHFHHHAIAIALAVRALLARKRHVAARDVLGELLQVLEALGDVVLHPWAAIDVLEDHFGRDLHGYRPVGFDGLRSDADSPGRSGFASLGRNGGSYDGRVLPLAAAELPLMAWSARVVPRCFCC